MISEKVKVASHGYKIFKRNPERKISERLKCSFFLIQSCLHFIATVHNHRANGNQFNLLQRESNLTFREKKLYESVSNISFFSLTCPFTKPSS